MKASRKVGPPATAETTFPGTGVLVASSFSLRSCSLVLFCSHKLSLDFLPEQICSLVIKRQSAFGVALSAPSKKLDWALYADNSKALMPFQAALCIAKQPHGQATS